MRGLRHYLRIQRRNIDGHFYRRGIRRQGAVLSPALLVIEPWNRRMGMVEINRERHEIVPHRKRYGPGEQENMRQRTFRRDDFPRDRDEREGQEESEERERT